jgi:hypothetical protein
MTLFVLLRKEILWQRIETIISKTPTRIHRRVAVKTNPETLQKIPTQRYLIIHQDAVAQAANNFGKRINSLEEAYFIVTSPLCHSKMRCFYITRVPATKIMVPGTKKRWENNGTSHENNGTWYEK